MPIYRRVRHNVDGGIVAITPATAGGTGVSFRVASADDVECCCPPMEPGCDDLTWAYPIYEDLEFLMDNTVVPDVPPWSEVNYDPLLISFDTSAEGITFVPELAENPGANVVLDRYSRFTGIPAVRIDTQFNIAQAIADFAAFGGTDSVLLRLVYFKDAPPTFEPIATLWLQLSFTQPNTGDTDVGWSLELVKFTGATGIPIGSDSGTESTYRVDADPGGGGLYDAGYYQFRLALVDDGTTVGAYLNDVLITSGSSEYIRDDVDLTDCIVQASLGVFGSTWEDDIPNPIFELWQFDVT